jgi:glycosyltransferase involved in cell wall biosynthesis
VKDPAPSRPIRVLYVDNSLGFGGAVKSLSLTLSALPSIEKFVLTSQDSDIVRMWFSGHRVLRFRRVFNYRNKDRIVGAIKSRPLKWAARKGFAFADLIETGRNSVRLAWIIRRNRIDLIHLNNGFVPREALGAAAIAGVPLIVHMRGIAEAGVSGSWLRNTSHVIAVSQAVVDSMRQHGIVPRAVTVIHDPVDLARVAGFSSARARMRGELGLHDRDIAVGIFGRVIRWKGQLEFTKAMIVAIRGNERLRAVIVGDEADGSAKYFTAIKDCIREAGLEQSFILAGYRANVEEFYAAVDIVAHASVFPEPFGMVVPEAMAARRPVIASDAGGPREIIENGVNGILVPLGDVDALAGAVTKLAADEGLRNRIADAGRRDAGRFSVATNARAVVAVYSAVLETIADSKA